MPRADLLTERLILTDIDETVLAFCPAFEAWMTARGTPPSAPMRDSTSYSMAELFRLPVAAIPELLDAFFSSEAAVTMAAEPAALAVLPRLRAAGWRFVAITASPDGADMQTRRQANLERAFGFVWEGVHCVGVKGSKAPALARYAPTLWVEDHAGHAVAGAELGHQSFLLDRPYNRAAAHPRLRRVADWHGIWNSLH